MIDKNVIKCAFCNWQRNKFYKNKKGKVISGYSALKHHIEICHKTEFKKVKQFIKQEDNIYDLP